MVVNHDTNMKSIIENMSQIFCSQFLASMISSSQISKDVPVTKWKGAHVDLRIQDQSLLQMSDTGACMSMHQPWASLLTAGIKR